MNSAPLAFSYSRLPKFCAQEIVHATVAVLALIDPSSPQTAVDC